MASDVERAKAKLAELVAKGNAMKQANNGSFCDQCGEVCTVESHIEKASLRAMKKRLGTDDPSEVLKAIGATVEPQSVSKAAVALKQARLRKGLTQEQLADEVGCSKRTVVYAEQGGHAMSGLVIRSLCRALDLDPRELGR
jgi:DNA-binding XRE family transcriptional regulator